MSQVAIVTDSTAYIPKDLLEKYQITTAPQVLIWSDKTYRDGVDIQPEEFYTRLKTATVMATTSQVTIASFKDIFSSLLDEGKEILAVLISEKLSGTIDSAVQAREMLPGAAIEVVNVDTGVSSAAETNQSGEYTVPLLQPGRYNLTARLDGFRTYSQTGITVELGRVIRLDLTLEVGQVTETVEVEAGPGEQDEHRDPSQ